MGSFAISTLLFWTNARNILEDAQSPWPPLNCQVPQLLLYTSSLLEVDNCCVRDVGDMDSHNQIYKIIPQEQTLVDLPMRYFEDGFWLAIQDGCFWFGILILERVDGWAFHSRKGIWGHGRGGRGFIFRSEAIETENETWATFNWKSSRSPCTCVVSMTIQALARNLASTSYNSASAKIRPFWKSVSLPSWQSLYSWTCPNSLR